MKTNEQQNVVDIHHNEPAVMPPTIPELCDKWLFLKTAEAKANAARIAVEEQLLPLVESNPNGSKTSRTHGYKIEVKRGVSAKLNDGGLAFINANVPENLRPLKQVLDETGLKWLQNNETEIYKKIAPFITTKPSKPGFTITELPPETMAFNGPEAA